MTRATEPARRAVLYLRVANSGSSNGVDLQRAACQRIAERHGLDIVREYVELNTPARLVDQTSLQQLLTDVEAKQDIAFVVVTDLARLARNLTSFQVISRLLRNAGAEIVTQEAQDISGLNDPHFDSPW